ESERLQHVRRLKCCRGASRSTGDGNIVDAHQQRFALNVYKTHIEVARETMLHGTVHVDVVEFGFKLVLEPIAEAAQIGGFAVHFGKGDFAGFAEANDSGNVQCAGTHAALVAATVNLGGDL